MIDLVFIVIIKKDEVLGRCLKWDEPRLNTFFLLFFFPFFIYMKQEDRGVKWMVKISEFQLKDVINIADGKKLGNVTDIDINLKTGRIEAIIIEGSGRFFYFLGRDNEIIISWKNILKIGEDVILVRYKVRDEIKYIEG